MKYQALLTFGNPDSINSVSPELGQLSVKGGSIESGAEIMAWQVDNTDNQKFYFEPVAL